jgi:glutamate/aspartate transport system substrate-binding protein
MKSTLVALAIASLAGTALAGGTVDKIKATGEITLGVRASGAPFSAVSDKGGYQGYSIDVCKKIVSDFDKKNGTKTKIEFKEVTTANRYVMLDNQGIDMECAGSSHNPDKLAVASYALHYTDSILAATLSTSKIKNLDDLSKSKLAIVSAFSGEKNVREFFVSKKVEATDTNLQKAENYDAMFMLLNQGRIDAAVTNKSLLMGIIAKQKTPADYRIVEETKIKENDRVGIVTWVKDQEFSAFAKQSVKDMFASGELEKFHKANFGESLSAESKRDIAGNQ